LPRVDFHTHSYHSDGVRSPANLVRRLKQYGVIAGALTDHNTVAGVDEAIAAGKRYGVKIYPGIEIYTQYRGRALHLLGLNIDHTHAKLTAWTNRAQSHRRDWFDASVDRLRALGFSIPHDARARYRSTYPAFPHLHDLAGRTPAGRKLLRARFGFLPGLFQFINSYFNEGCPAHVPQLHLPFTTPQAIALVRQIGGIPILAHPGHHLRWEDDPLIGELKRKGLRGIEVIHPYHNWHQVEHYQELAEEHHFLVSGGTDYHGDTRLPLYVANPWDYLAVPTSIYRDLKPHLQ